MVTVVLSVRVTETFSFNPSFKSVRLVEKWGSGLSGLVDRCNCLTFGVSAMMTYYTLKLCVPLEVCAVFTYSTLEVCVPTEVCAMTYYTYTLEACALIPLNIILCTVNLLYAGSLHTSTIGRLCNANVLHAGNLRTSNIGSLCNDDLLHAGNVRTSTIGSLYSDDLSQPGTVCTCVKYLSTQDVKYGNIRLNIVDKFRLKS